MPLGFTFFFFTPLRIYSLKTLLSGAVVNEFEEFAKWRLTGEVECYRERDCLLGGIVQRGVTNRNFQERE